MTLFSIFGGLLAPARNGELVIGRESMHEIQTTENTIFGMRARMRYPVTRLVGYNAKYKIELENEPNQHVMMVGHTGSGKSTAMQAFLARAFLNYGIPFLIIDWSGSYKKLKGTINVWSVPDELRINPFALRNMNKEQRAGIASETLMHALDLTPLQTQKVRETLARLYEKNKEPELRDLYESLREQSGDKNFMKMQFAHIANKLRQASSVFGYEPHEFWSDYSETCNVVELEGLTDAEKKLVTYALLQRIIEQFTTEGVTKLYIALDDAYQAMKSTYNNESPISKIVREGRKYGFGLVISTQLLSDLPQAVIANTSIKMAFSYQEHLGSRDISNLMGLKYTEQELMRRLAPGWCLLFDQHRANNEEHVPAYVNIMGLSSKETELLSKKGKKADIKRITQVASMTIDNPERAKLFNDIIIPSVSVYRFMLALRSTGNTKDAYKLLRKNGWLTSLTTIYGTKTKPSILSRAKAEGYVNENGELTEKAMKIFDPTLMVERQGIRQGSEEHKSMMIKVIEFIQAQGYFAMVPSCKNAPDVVMIPAHHEAKGVWDFDTLHIYECQTNAIPSEIAMCIERARSYDAFLTIVVGTENLKEQINAVTLGKCLVLDMNTLTTSVE